jgi:CRISPR-associated protein Csm1
MNKDQVILGALLHDIGKFAQRAGVRLSEADKAIESSCCPLYHGRYTHRHVLHSGKFFRETWGSLFLTAELMALFHHRPDTCTQKKSAMMVALADRLSSGERQAREDDEEVGNPRDNRLLSIFNNLASDIKTSEPRYFPLKPLNNDLAQHFPEMSKSLGKEESYDGLWSSFLEEAGFLRPDDFHSVFLRQLLFLLEKYTLFVPSAAYRERPDLSLFHHSKSTAAIVTCLCKLDPDEEELAAFLKGLKSAGDSEWLEKAYFYLIGGDISGIQNFIYAVASKGALKGMRGRSIYLQLLSEGLAEGLIQALGLNPTCLIYSGGGHFYLLAPKLNDTEEVLQSRREQINRVLVKAHRGKVTVGLSWRELSCRDFLGKAFGKAWDQLGADLAREKRRKVWTVLEEPEGANSIFGPLEVTGEEQGCSVCGEFISPDGSSSSGEKIRCPFCKSFEQLASRVARAEILAMELRPDKSLPENITECWEVLDSLGVSFSFQDHSSDPQREFRLNETSFLSPRLNYLGFRFIGKHSPLNPAGDLKALEDLAEASTGISKWGVLRADVDHLGQVFRAGLAGEDRSISRLSMLSHLISLYFSAHIQVLVHRKPFHEGVSLVYSGGDDLFALGAWSMLPDLARRIADDFSRFTGDVLHLSAGLFLAPSAGYPVYQAAAAAGEEEDNAKNAGRNRFSIFQTPIPWERFSELEAIKDILVKLIQNNSPRSIFSMLYATWEDQKLAREKETSMFRVWRLLYGLRRLQERKKSLLPDLKELETRIIKDLWMPNFTNVGVRWAEYLTRGKGDA